MTRLSGYLNPPAFDAHLLLRGIMPNKWDEETKEQAVRLVVKTPQMTTPFRMGERLLQLVSG
jgi:hypothetical protein